MLVLSRCRDIDAVFQGIIYPRKNYSETKNDHLAIVHQKDIAGKRGGGARGLLGEFAHYQYICLLAVREMYLSQWLCFIRGGVRQYRMVAVLSVFLLLAGTLGAALHVPEEVPANEIWYTSTDGYVVRPREKAFKQKIVSNTYREGKGIITFDAALTSIGPAAFLECGTLLSVQMPRGITRIERSAFCRCCSLNEVQLPDSLKYMKTLAFSECVSLADIVLPERLQQIDKGAFYQCVSLRGIVLPGGLKEINSQAFASCSSLEWIVFPEGMVTIHSGVFEDCPNLVSLDFPESLTNIYAGAFGNCIRLKEVRLPDGIRHVTSGAFAGCDSLERFSGPMVSADGRCIIEDGRLSAFAPSGLTEYAIPSGIKQIGREAFFHCRLLKRVVISEGVEAILDDAFGGCSSLEEVQIPGSIVGIGKGAFAGCPKLERLSGPLADPDRRCIILDSVLVGFAPSHIGRYVVPKGVTRIEERAFEGCDQLRSVVLPEGLLYVRSRAFNGCSMLEDVSFPSTLSRIKTEAFAGCESLTTIHLSSTEPPELERTREFDYVETIYVPRESLEAYKSSPGWMGYFDKMKPSRRQSR